MSAFRAAPADAEQVVRDRSFAGDGLVTVDFDHRADVAAAAALQADGKLVVAGRSEWAGQVGSGSDVVVARYSVNGTLDPTFGINGLFVLNLGAQIQTTAVALQPDGRILVGGSLSAAHLILRLDTKGQLDPSFADQGILLREGDTLHDLLVQPDGRIVTAGNGFAGGMDLDMIVTRYLPDGEPDPSFGTGGRGVITTGSTPTLLWFEEAFAIAQLDDGAYAVVGRRSGAGPGIDVIVGRLTGSGLPDPAFNGSGYRVFDFATDEGAMDVLADSGGRMVVGVYVNTGSVTMARLLPSGTLDPSFGAGGLVGNGPLLSALARDRAGRLLVAGMGPSAEVARYSASGVLDTTFAGGRYRSDVNPANEVPTDLVVLPDGRIVVVGFSYASTTSSFGSYDTDWTIERLVLTADQAPTLRSGYWLLGATGRIYAFGDAVHRGSIEVAATNLTSSSSGNGYWAVSASGGVFAFGDAPYLGGTPGLGPGERVTSISATPSGAGYWLFTTTGRVHAYGDARHVGDLRASRLNGAVLGSVATPSGKGYYMVAADGGVFAFGDAVFRGSMGGQRLNGKVVGLAPDPDGDGYWLVAEDGGIFAFNAPFKGSMGGQRLNKPFVGLVAFGDGYLGVASDGGVFNFSSRPFSGSLGASPPAEPIVAVAPLPQP